MNNAEPDKQRPRTTGPMGRTVADNVRNARIEQGLTLRQVSEQSKGSTTPLSLDALSKIENGLRRIDVDDLAVLSMILDAPPIELLGGNRVTRAQVRLRELNARDAELGVFESFIEDRRRTLNMELAQATTEADPQHGEGHETEALDINRIQDTGEAHEEAKPLPDTVGDEGRPQRRTGEAKRG